MNEATLTLRPATEHDAAAVARLVELEQALPLTGEVLLAELDGRAIAAVCVGEDRAVADIFRPTAELVAMLRAWRDALIRARRFSHANAGVAERPHGVVGLLTRRRAGGGDDKSLKGGDDNDRLDGGNGNDLECLGADVVDFDGDADQDTVTNCE